MMISFHKCNTCPNRRAGCRETCRKYAEEEAEAAKVKNLVEKERDTMHYNYEKVGMQLKCRRCRNEY